MDNGQSVFAAVPTCQFSSLLREVKKNGRSAINNRMNSAVRLRGGGHIKAAERAEEEAKIMQTMATTRGLTL